MRQALSVASECAPLIKTGGLADVVGALPAALAATGWRLRTLLPGYPDVIARLKRAKAVYTRKGLFGGDARVLAATVDGLDLLVLDAPHLYDRAGAIYLGPDGRDWPDNPQRFAALSRVAAEIAERGIGGWRPEVLHLHDWQAGLAPLYLGDAASVGSILTVHNIAFQGLAPASMLATLGLPADRFGTDGFEYWGHISALKAGLTGADRITTVSPTYAQELTRAEFGMGLEGVIASRRDVVSGILNGIDLALWNPATDPNIVAGFKTPRGKAKNKAALEATFGLPTGDGPLAVVISRLTGQKGLDLLLEVLPDFLGRGGRLALLGSGDPGLEASWLQAAADDRVGVRIGYDEALSHRMVAGADAILVPSRFEPCGLTQLYGLRYGAVPVVAQTGGLADTVINASDAGLKAGVATGIQFSPVTADALHHALTRLAQVFADKPTFATMQRNAMRHPVGWQASAPQYAALYADVADLHR